jgi:hypothetical protein
MGEVDRLTGEVAAIAAHPEGGFPPATPPTGTWTPGSPARPVPGISAMLALSRTIRAHRNEILAAVDLGCPTASSKGSTARSD